MGTPPIEELRRIFSEAHEAWPEIALELDTFVARLEDAGSEALAHAHDLYLACACSDGNAAALARFERDYLDAADEAIARIDAAPEFVSEVKQLLSARLLVGPTAKIREYRGSGGLVGWVRTAAVRTALNLQRSYKRVDAGADAAREPGRDPEVALIKAHHQADISAALQRAVERLEPADRQLLRFYYVESLTLARIAVLQDIGVSIVFRQLTAATKALLAAVKTDLAERLGLSPESLESLLRDVQQGMTASLTQLLTG
jgi:RNA polymerase sigma-70 factor (ECF subfamily)